MVADLEVPEGSSGQSFTLLLNRSLSRNVIGAQWCPTMDLLAVLLADGQLHLHRLNWQRLWAFVPDSPIQSFAWRPDGKELCIGHEDGTISLLSSENGQMLGSLRVSSGGGGGMQTIQWILARTEGDASEGGQQSLRCIKDRDRRFLEPPFEIGREQSGAGGMKHATYDCRLQGRRDAKWPSRFSGLSVIVCVTGCGRLVICSESLFELINIPFIPHQWLVDAGRHSSENVQRAGTASQCSAGLDNDAVAQDTSDGLVMQVAMAHDMSEVSSCWQDALGNVCLSKVDVSCLSGSSQRSIVCFCSAAAAVLHDAKESLESSKDMSNEIEKMLKAKHGMIASLNELLRAHGMGTDAQGDLLLLVTMGEYSHAMEQFLTSTMQESGLKRVSKSIDHALSSAYAILIDRLLPATESLAFRLGELRGLVAHPEGWKILGIHATEVYKLETLILDQINHAEQLRIRLVDVTAQYRTFFCWLITALRRFPEDTVDTHMGYPLSHIDEVRKFLHGEFKNGSLEKLVGVPKTDHGPDLSSLNGTYESKKEMYNDCLLKDSAAGDHEWGLFSSLDNDLFSQEEESLEYFLALMERSLLESACKPRDEKSVFGPNPIAAGDTVTTPRSDGILWAMEKISQLCASLLEKATKHLSAQVAKQSVTQAILFPSLEGVNGENGRAHQPPDSRSMRPRLHLSMYYEEEVEPVEQQENSMEGSVVPKLVINFHSACGSDTASHQVLSSMEPRDQQRSSWLMRASFASKDLVADLSGFVLPNQYTLMDMGVYKDGDVALLLSHPSAGKFALVPQAFFEPVLRINAREILDNITLVRSKLLDIAELRVEDLRCRKLPYLEVNSPLAVSGTRGVAFVLNGIHRGLILDLVEDEGDDIDNDDGLSVENQEQTQGEDNIPSPSTPPGVHVA